LVNSLDEVEEMLWPSSPCYPVANTKPLAQEYLMNVNLLEGHKYTIRIYALITSFDPLRLYIYADGLVRICSEKYSNDLSTLKNLFVHIDSIDINIVKEKEFDEAVKGSDLIHEGLRCDVQYLLKRLAEKHNANATKIWEDIKHILMMSIMSSEKHLYPAYMEIAVNGRKRRLAPFEMPGYDILIDNDMNSWLLEINNNPSMSPHTNLENVIKQNLIHDVMDLVDIENSDRFEMDELIDKTWIRFFYVKSLNDQRGAGDMMLNTFNVSMIKESDDLRAIIETEYERQRLGKFEPVFPTKTTSHYLPMMINPRNKLVQAWMNADLSLNELLQYIKKQFLAAIESESLHDDHIL